MAINPLRPLNDEAEVDTISSSSKTVVNCQHATAQYHQKPGLRVELISKKKKEKNINELKEVGLSCSDQPINISKIRNYKKENPATT